jgi:hypothetical protein
MNYCSYEARKVHEYLDNYGIELHADDWFDVELACDVFYVSHVVQVLEQVLRGGNTAKKLEKIAALGWAYFDKPIKSILGDRDAAHRKMSVTNGIDLQWDRAVYGMVTRGFALADFSPRELSLIIEIASMITEPLQFTNAKQACRESRSIFYLHGVVRREYQTAQGRIREIQQRHDESAAGWSPPEDHEQMDVIDRRILEQEWRDRLNSIAISKALDNA